MVFCKRRDILECYSRSGVTMSILDLPWLQMALALALALDGADDGRSDVRCPITYHVLLLVLIDGCRSHCFKG